MAASEGGQEPEALVHCRPNSDNDENISYWNEAAERIFGYLKEEIEGKNIQKLIIPERYRKKHLKGFERFKATGVGKLIGKTLEVAGIRKGGTEIPIELSLSSVKIKDNWNAIGMVRDITERKKAEEQLRKLSQAVEQSPATVIITDADGKIEYVNSKFTQLTGYTFEEAVGETSRILKSGKQSAEVYREMWETITSGKEWQGEFNPNRMEYHFKLRDGCRFIKKQGWHRPTE